MFGDIGHGLVVFILGIILCLNNTSLSKTILKPDLVARYSILLLGFFQFFVAFYIMIFYLFHYILNLVIQKKENKMLILIKI